jgi:hypothetical protein
MERGLPRPTDDVTEGLRNLTDHGVTIHPGFVSPEIAVQLLERAEEQAAEERRLGVAMAGTGGMIDHPPPAGTGPMPYQRVECLPNKGRAFLDVAMHPVALTYASGVFGSEPFHLFAQTAMFSRRGLPDQVPHIDQINLPPAMCAIPAIVNVFVCLTGMDRSMGATRLAPGTHRLPRPDYATNEHLSVEYFHAEVEAGTAVIWEGRTWHAGSAHTAERTRGVISTDYGLACIKPNETYTAWLSDDVYEELTPDELDFLGFRSGASGFNNLFGPRNANDVRTNTNRHHSYVGELHTDT